MQTFDICDAVCELELFYICSVLVVFILGVYNNVFNIIILY
jgi:hypothetical protein